MTEVKRQKISLRPIVICFVLSLLFFLWFLFFRSQLDKGIIFLTIGIFLWSRRRKGYSFFLDKEGIIVSMFKDKIYWNEIKEIKNSRILGIKSTVLSPHYDAQGDIKKRHGIWMVRMYYSIPWFLIEDPQDFHESIMQFWNHRKKDSIIAESPMK